jgi:hypothetical protein
MFHNGARRRAPFLSKLLMPIIHSDSGKGGLFAVEPNRATMHCRKRESKQANGLGLGER